MCEGRLTAPRTDPSSKSPMGREVKTPGSKVSGTEKEPAKASPVKKLKR